jgi:hypothetical protein
MKLHIPLVQYRSSSIFLHWERLIPASQTMVSPLQSIWSELHGSRDSMTQDHMDCPLSASELSAVSHFPSPKIEEMLCLQIELHHF